MSFVTHLSCAHCEAKFESEKLWNLCPDCGKPLLVHYDIESASRAVSKSDLASRPDDLWRYHEMLPVCDPNKRLTLGEGFTPLFKAERLASKIGATNLYIKDEGVNPTTSFKARGMAVAISRALELGAGAISVPSAGNAAGAMSAYAALAGLPAFVFMPKDVPHPFIAECKALGAKVTLIEGLITDCGKAAAAEISKDPTRFDVSTLKEPYRIEGKKTMGYEIAEQMGWTLPDVIIYPTGGGTGLIGMWKAFDEMEQLGWIGSKRPRMVTVQSIGCAPIVRAFERGTEFAEPWQNAATKADGLRVPAAVGDFLILRALRQSQGTAIAVTDDEMITAAQQIGRTQGIFPAPEGGASLAAFQKLQQQNWIKPDESTVLFNTGSGHKYAHLY